MDELVFPNESFNSKIFDIFIPDSVYTAGQITIKKLSFSNLKMFAYFSFSNNEYKNVVYNIKRKKKKEFEAYVVAKLNLKEFSDAELLSLKIKVTIIKKGRKIEYSFAKV